MYSTFLREAQLIGFAYDLEQELNVRRPPQFLGFVSQYRMRIFARVSQGSLTCSLVEHISSTSQSSKVTNLRT